MHAAVRSGVAGLILAAAACGTAIAQPPAAEAQPVPATIGQARQFDFTSGVNGKTYRVTVATPWAAAPKDGYPIIYVLDGGAYFASFAGAARMRSALGGELPPAVVVGIGYPADSMLVALQRRFRDLTPSAPVPNPNSPNLPGGPGTEYAGAEEFLKVIQTEIRPQVAKMAPVATGKDVLFGHSLGGLFVLHTLFNHPDAFHTYLALSPSIWWSNRSVLEDEAAFTARVTAMKATPRVYIGVGAMEETPGAGLTPQQAADMRDARMVTDASQLAARLTRLKGGPGYRVESKVFEGQSHVSVPWEALNTLLAYGLAP